MQILNSPFPLSYSRITAFDCPWYAFNKYHIEICDWLDSPFDPKIKPAPVGVNTQCGKFGHEVIREYTGSLQEKNIQSDLSIMKDWIDRNWKVGVPESEYDEMEWCLTRFAETHLFKPDQIYGVEMPLAFRKAFSFHGQELPLRRCEWNGDHENIPEDIYICGILDLCEMPDPETLIITDYKFAWAAKSKSELRRDLQGKLYSWYMSLINPSIKNYIVRFDYVRKNIVVDLEYTPDEVARMAERVSRISTRVKTDMEKRGNNPENWPASPCNLCQYCLYKCPFEGNRYQIMKTIDEYGGPESLGQKILELDILRKRYNDVMKAYTKNERPVTVSGQQFGYHIAEFESYEPELVFDRLEHDKAWEIMKVDTAKLNAKKRADMKEAIADLVEIKTSQRYGIKKIDIDESEND